MIRFILLVGVGLLPLAVAGSSGGEDDAGSSGNTSEQELAESMLLALSDFPVGWAEEADSEEEESSPTAKCEFGSEGRTGRANTGDFSDGSSASISQSLGIFESVSDVSSRLDQLRSGEVGDCFIGVIEDGGLDDEEITFSDASQSEISFPEIGDETVAVRIEVRYELVGETGFGSEGSIFIDLISVGVDRVGFTVQGSDVLSPYDVGELESYVRTAEARAREKLATQ
jgi:hypothetical protein